MLKPFKSLGRWLGSSPWKYLHPFLAIASALGLQGVVASFLPRQNDFPFAFFYLMAVFFVAWISGYIPGLIACLITMIGLPWLTFPEFRLANVDLSKLLVFAGISMGISRIAQVLRRRSEFLSIANEELDRRVQARTQDLNRAIETMESEIAQRRKTEAALRESEQRVDLALDVAAVGRWDMDLATHKIRRSLRHDKIFGYDQLLPEWTFQSFCEHVVPEDRLAIVEVFEAALSSHEAFEYDCRIQEPGGGSIRWVWGQAKVIRDEAGEAVSMLGSIRDITKRKIAEERLRTQLERMHLLDQITRSIAERLDLNSTYQVVLNTLTDNLPIDFGCMCIHEPEGSLTVSVCAGASQPIAQSMELTQGARIDIERNGLARCVAGQLVYEADLGASKFPLSAQLAGGGLSAVVFAPLVIENKVFGVLITARRQSESFSSGECEFLRQLSEHVALATHQHKMHEALQQAFNDLRQSQQTVMQHERLRALGQMASGIAHDINNAISPVALYTESLLESEPNLSKRTREYLETTQRAIDDVAHTVARMREFYRMNQEKVATVPVDVSRLAQQVLDLTRARWNDIPQKLGLVMDLHSELSPDLPKVAGIESEIREALINLVFNAVDAMPEGGRLSVRTRFTPGQISPVKVAQVHVEVSDTGIGMDEETRRRCLEPFFTTKGERGTGLGLAMTYGVAQRHNAEITLDSEPGKGTTARISFPVPASMAPQAGPAPEPIVEIRRILVVDDDPLLISSLRDSLAGDGHAVSTAPGGQAGIDAFQAAEEKGDRFDVVFTDLGMPYVDGCKVARAVKMASPSTPVILLTGWGQRMMAEGEIPPHVDRVLSKPPKLRDLRTAIADLTALEPVLTKS